MIVKNNLSEVSNPKAHAFNRVFWNYGERCFLGEGRKEGGHMEYPVYSYYPFEITDQKTNKTKTIFIEIDESTGSLGKIKVNLENMKVTAPSVTQINANLTDKVERVSSEVEKSLSMVASDNLSKAIIRQYKMLFDPIFKISTNLQRRDLSFEEIEINQYGHYIDLFLLEGLITIDERSRIISPSLTFTQYQTTTELSDKIELEFEEVIFSLFLKNHFDYILNKLKIKTFLPYIKIPASLYQMSLGYDGPIETTESNLTDFYDKIYHKSPSMEFGFSKYLDDLNRVKILDYDGENVNVNDEIFNDIKSLNKFAVRQDTFFENKNFFRIQA